MFCEKCGKELNSEAKFCVGCGSPNPGYLEPNALNNQINAPTPIESPICNEPTNAFTNNEATTPAFVEKAKNLRPAVLISIGAAILAFIVILIVVITSTAKNNAYRDKLSKAYEKITETAEIAEDYATLETKVWRNSIYESDSWETNKYTKNSYGSFYDDFNDALTQFYIGESSNYDLVKAATAEIDKLMLELKNCPSKFKDDYETLKELYVAYSDLADLVIGNSSYSYNSFSEALDEAKSDYKSAVSDAKIAIG